MKLAILGATGMVGKVLTRSAIEAGHDVTLLVRSPEKLGDLAEQVRIIHGEYFNRDDVRRTLEGAEGVLTTIGPPMKRSRNRGEYTSAMQTLISVMAETDVKRIIAIGGAGVRLGDEKMALGRAFMRRALILLSGANYLDKEGEHNALCASDLDWTIVRPPQITSAEGAFVVRDDKVAAFKADTQQLATYMLDCLGADETIRTAPFVATV